MAKKYGEFPIILETYRECLRDVLDVPGPDRAADPDPPSRADAGRGRDEHTASPFASSLLFDYVATYMYEGDTPNAERRAAALSLDRDLLRELLGQEELRDLIDPARWSQVEADLQCLSEPAQATGRDGLLDVLRRVGDLTEDEIDASGCSPAWTRRRCSRSSAAERRATKVRVNGQERWIDAADAGLYRDALGAAPCGRAADRLPGGRARRDGCGCCALRRHPRPVHHRRGPRPLRDRRRGRSLRELERAGDLVQGELRPGGSAREWC